MSQFIFRIDL